MIISHELIRNIHAQPANSHARHILTIAIGSSHTDEIQKTQEEPAEMRYGEKVT